MSDFGDFEPDDAYAADGELEDMQLAIRLHEIRSALLELAGQGELPPWWEYDRAELEIEAAGEVLRFFVLHVPPAELAERIHEARRQRADTTLDEWEHLPPDAREVAVEIAGLVYDWATRQGAVR